MAKLYFRYGAMNSGKSTLVLQAAHNYGERGQLALLAKPRTDSKGGDHVVSRLGVSRRVDFVIEPEADLVETFRAASRARPAAALLIDEAQFLSPEQVDAAFRIAVVDDVPVLTYGIRTDFQTRSFRGSARLMEIAHSLEELKTICRCGRKAVFNTRTVGGRFVFDGEQVAIDGEDVGYESLCGQCYLRESGGRMWS